VFTGLIQKLGHFAKLERAGRVRIRVECETPWADPLEHGESIAVEGVCLTVAEHDASGFWCDVLDETLQCSTLGACRPGDRLNLERALAIGDRLGGHMVQGHIDGTGVVDALLDEGRDRIVRITCLAALSRDILLKGSVALSGVSLTVTAVSETGFAVNIIPVTWKETSLQALKAGTRVNVETDVIGKYVRRHLEGREAAGGLTLDDLRRAGID
jgi:riboflavin synthase